MRTLLTLTLLMILNTWGETSDIALNENQWFFIKDPLEPIPSDLKCQNRDELKKLSFYSHCQPEEHWFWCRYPDKTFIVFVFSNKEDCQTALMSHRR